MPSDPDYWEALLRREGLTPEPKPIKPIPRRDRKWTDHFGSAEEARQDAVERMQTDMRSAQELFSMLADIRWGRHSDSIKPLTPREHAVIDRYCDGQTEQQIADALGVSQHTISYRLRKTLARFTRHKLQLARGVKGQKRRE